MKKIHLIFLSLFVIWGCGGGGGSGDSPQAPVVSGGTLSITWNMGQSTAVEENSNGATLIDANLNNSTAKLSFSLSGTDSSKFSISNGYLVFTDSPDFENPLDNNVDNSYALTTNSFSELHKLTAYLYKNPSLKISIEGHTDNIGNPKANKLLSENRAKSVYDYLLVKGVSSSQLVSYSGYGENKPISENSTKEGRAKNRRIEINVN